MSKAAVIEFARHKSVRCGAVDDIARDYDEHLGGQHVCARVHDHAVRSEDPDHICRCGHTWEDNNA